MRRPAFVLTSALTLGLGVGAVTAMGAVVQAVLFRPLPWRDVDRLVTVSMVRPSWRQDPLLARLWDRTGIFWNQIVDLQTHSHTLLNVSAWSPGRSIVSNLPDGSAQPTPAAYVTSGLLPLLGVQLVSGRGFEQADDDRPSEGVLIGYAAAIRWFGEPSPLGRLFTVDGVRRTVVGVLPPRFTLDPAGVPLDICLPFGALSSADKAPGFGFMTVAKLAPSLSPAQALAEVEPIIRGGLTRSERTARIGSLTEDQLGPARQPLGLLFGAAGLLLLLAASNVASLFLGELAAREPELATRTALGATPGQLSREIGAELALIGLAALGLGLALATVATPVLAAMAPTHLPRVETIAVDLSVIRFAVLVTVPTVIAIGLVPLLRLGRTRAHVAVLLGSRVSRRRASGSLVASQVALALVLTLFAGLFSETFLRLTSEHIGFDPRGLIVVTTRPLDPAGISTDSRTADLVAALSAAPGVEAAAGIARPPFAGGIVQTGLDLEHRRGEGVATALKQVVTTSYFATMKVPVLEGRVFDGGDGAAGHVAVVSQTFARRYFSGAATDQRFRIDDWWTIVGVVADVKQRGLGDADTPTIYLLDRQATTPHTRDAIAEFVVRTTTGLSAGTLRSVVARARPELTVTAVATMTSLVDQSVGAERYRAVLATVFGAAALLVAGVGLYGLLARTVAHRRREIGVRMALGASKRAILLWILADGGRFVLAGLGVGLVGAAIAGRLTAALLFGVTPTAPHVWLGVVAVVGASALLAMIGPARLAVRTDPLVALRAD